MTGAAHWPAGATRRVHQLPKASRYAVVGSGGSVVRTSGMTMSEAREACVVTIRIMGVA